MDQRDEMDNQLGSVKEKAYKDPLTNVRNKDANKVKERKGRANA